MITVTKENEFVTLINVFSVDPANQQRLVNLLAQATSKSVRHAPGFVSAGLHRSLDGTKVAMYAQWRSIEAYNAMRQNNVAAHYFEEALAIAKFDPGMYEVSETFEGDLTNA
jgi:quinol monooxygenase YgiN